MTGEFGTYIDSKRKGRGIDGADVLQKDMALAMGVSNVYVTDMIKGRRYPPNISYLEKLIDILKLSPEEWEEMLDIAGREREEAAPDLPEYLMSEDIPHVRVALRRANDKHLGDDFWKTVVKRIEKQ
jgi:transcriptional regulator with XRE-family HTH domain